ncbi:hypothetical protein ANME2D_00896 [Candidatus Methanoperedens nitroreducens]|uniref:Amine oxidase domain-containing protein n=1 Tax=Candidatus Methanoperedens nitratireducens TaxID=1392998 RepID=A0A062V9T2_9EURY|nr:FAD-dependent oxidoreductase [Candidatus Methanoperedens nitroreducens]KCZ72469.1 hypothetical protein ANME2D_00896 [Candidatus Methanoperedens nitroreducens]MDJ1423597.1 oleate hydratase [Candidatus Methanoperedens sp.]
MRAVVVGGGIGGLSCAIGLMDCGFDVSLFDKNNKLGGVARTLHNTDYICDTGLHYFFEHYTECMSLLKKCNADKEIFWIEDRMLFMRADSKKGMYSHLPLPGALRGASAIARFNLLNFSDRLKLLGLFAKMAFLKDEQLSEMDNKTLEEWVLENGGNAEIISNYFDPISRSLTFMGASEISAQTIIVWFNGIRKQNKIRFGIAVSGLSESVIEPLKNYLLSRGCKIYTGCEIKSITINDGKVHGVNFKDSFEQRFIDADVVVLAVSPAQVNKILRNSPTAGKQSLIQMDEGTPVIVVNLLLSSNLTDEKIVMFGVNTCFNIFMEITNVSRNYSENHSLVTLIMNSTEDQLHMSEGEIQSIVLNDLESSLGYSIREKIADCEIFRLNDVVTKQVPGHSRSRVDNKTDIEGLYLSGDYTAGIQPSGMNASVHSANTCVLKIKNDFRVVA